MQMSAAGKLIVVMLAVVFVGCLPSEPEGDAPTEELYSEATPGELVTEFTAMAQDPATNNPDFRRFVIAKQLAGMGPRTLSPLIAIIAAPDSSPETRLFTLQCMNGLLGPAYIAELKPLLASEDNVVRACAVTLLGHIRDPQVLAELRPFLDDSAWGVRFASLSGMAVQGDAGSRAKLSEMYFGYPEEDSEVAVDEARIAMVRQEILRVLLLAPVAEDIAIFHHAVVEPSTDMTTRVVIVALLHDIGDLDSIGPLEQSVSTNDDPEYADLVDMTVKGIREQDQEVVAGS